MWGIRATIGRLRAVTARTTIRVTLIAWADPEVAAWKKIDATAADPIAEASCWIDLSEPLALPAATGEVEDEADDDEAATKLGNQATHGGESGGDQP